MTTEYKLLRAEQHTRMLLTLKKAIQICEDAHHVPFEEYPNVDLKETYPGALGHAHAVLMVVFGPLIPNSLPILAAAIC